MTASDTPKGVLPRLGPATLSPGSVIGGRYIVLTRIASGGMSEVYKVRHVELRKVLALKVMSHRLSEDAEFVARFKQEAIATSGIGQLNIVDVSDFGRTDDGRFYFVMEYLDGVTLAAMLRGEGAPTVGRVLSLAVQLARALAAAHSLGVVHRDLKPENVMVLQRPGQPDLLKVVDFGVAKLLDSKSQTSTGRLLGTPRYMSPEQIHGGPIDARCDVYALGLIIYELLAGRPAFDDPEPASLLLKQLNELPPPLKLGREAPAGLVPLLDAMLGKAPEQRPDSMVEVIERLEALQRELRTVAGPPWRRIAPWAALAAASALTALGVVAVVRGRARAFPVDRSPTPAAVPPSLSASRPSAEPASREVGTATIILTSSPTGADVYEGDLLLGRTPLELSRPLASRASLRLSLDGYRPEVRALEFNQREAILVGLQRLPRSAPVPSRERTPVDSRKPRLPELVEDAYGAEEPAAPPLKAVHY
jgi:serine/threonine-protein kinase